MSIYKYYVKNFLHLLETPKMRKLIHFLGSEELSIPIKNPHFRETYSPIYNYLFLFGVCVDTQVKIEKVKKFPFLEGQNKK